MTNLPHLIERCESGEGPDRELDCLIEAVLDGRTIRESGNMTLARNSRPPHDEYIVGWIDPGVKRRNFSDGHSVPPVRRYTTSLDAVVSLIQQKLPGWKWSVMSFADQFKGNAWSDDLEVELYAFAQSPARTLLAAALKALENRSAPLADATPKNGDHP